VTFPVTPARGAWLPAPAAAARKGKSRRPHSLHVAGLRRRSGRVSPRPVRPVGLRVFRLRRSASRPALADGLTVMSSGTPRSPLSLSTLIRTGDDQGTERTLCALRCGALRSRCPSAQCPPRTGVSSPQALAARLFGVPIPTSGHLTSMPPLRPRGAAQRTSARVTGPDQEGLPGDRDSQLSGGA